MWKYVYSFWKLCSCEMSQCAEKNGFVSFWLPISYQRAFKRASFALQKGTFYTSKDALLRCKRASFTMQKGISYFSIELLIRIYITTQKMPFYIAKGRLLQCKRACIALLIVIYLYNPWYPLVGWVGVCNKCNAYV